MRPKARPLTAVGIAAATPFLAAASASAAPPHGDPTIEISTTNGSGCSRETVTITPEPTGFTVRYSGYSAKFGGDAVPTDFRKNCQLSLQIALPESLTYAVARIDYRGSAQLAPEATGVLRASFYYAGVMTPTRTFRTFKGPFSDGWLVTQVVDPGELVYVPCGEQRNLNLNTELRVSDTDRTRTSTMDMNSEVGSTYHFAWRTCPQPGDAAR